MYQLEKIGYQSFFNDQVGSVTSSIGRVATSSNGIYRILSTEEEFRCHLSGKLYHQFSRPNEFPCVGDWVLFTPTPHEAKGVVTYILDRKSLISRHAAGDVQEEQLLAANVDIVFLVNALNSLNVRLMERYLIQVYESGADPVFILTKRDLCEDVEVKLKAVEDIAIGIPIIMMDTLNDSLDSIKNFFKPGITVSVLGSSGVCFAKPEYISLQLQIHNVAT